MKGYLHGGPDLKFGPADRWVDAMGQELQVPVYDGIGFSPLLHVWVPTPKVVTDLANGQYRIWDYFGLVYRDGAVHPRAEDKAKADLRLKWWQVEDLMKELGVNLELRVVPSYSVIDSSIDFWDVETNTFIEIDSAETDLN